MSALLITGCTKKDSGNGDNEVVKTAVDKIKENGKLTVYTEAGFAPYEFYSDNKIVGVDVELMQKVADKIGVELEVTDVNFDTIVGSVQSGKADVGAAGITITDERAESVNFSKGYSTSAQYVIVIAEDDSVKTVEDLNGKTIGIQQGTTSDMLVEKLINEGTLKDSEYIGYTSPAVAAASLGSKVDAVVTDELTAIIVSGNGGGKYKAFKLVNADGSDVSDVESYGIAVAKGNDDLLAIINEVIDETTKDGSINKWIVEYSDLANDTDSEESDNEVDVG